MCTASHSFLIRQKRNPVRTKSPWNAFRSRIIFFQGKPAYVLWRLPLSLRLWGRGCKHASEELGPVQIYPWLDLQLFHSSRGVTTAPALGCKALEHWSRHILSDLRPVHGSIHFFSMKIPEKNAMVLYEDDSAWSHLIFQSFVVKFSSRFSPLFIIDRDSILLQNGL